MCHHKNHERDLLSGLQKSYKITEVIKKNDRISSIVLDTSMDLTPGQFVMVWIPRVDEKPYSVDIPNPLTITFAQFGPFTKALLELKVGDRLGIRGPLGRGFKIVGNKALVVAGGVGLASVSNLVRTMRTQDIDVDLVVGARTKDELYDLDEFISIGVNVFPTTDDGSYGFHGFTTDQSQLLLNKNAYDQAYVCGPEIMMVRLKTIFDKTKMGYQMSLERYMKCGIGICDQCSLSDTLVCMDGPVYTREALDLLDEFGTVYRTKSGQEQSRQ